MRSAIGWFVLVCVVMAQAPASAQERGATPSAAELARLDGFAEGLTRAGQFSGVVLIAVDDEVVFEKAYGPIDPAADAPATVDTRYNLASAGKMFTAVAILQLIADGKLTLDTRVGEVMPAYASRAFREQVTIRHLLTHRAGAGGIDLFGVENATRRAEIRTHAQMVALHDGRAPEFPPGTDQKYGNFGFVVLGRVVEILSGLSFEDYVQQRIFAPAKMTRTGFVDCTHRSPDLAVGYATVDGKRVSNCATVPTRGFAAGGEVSTARDMFRFARALHEGRLIPLALYREATRTHHQFMGLGLFATGYGPGVPESHFRWGHGGSADGINADIRYYPASHQTVVVLANRDAPAAHEIANFQMAQPVSRPATP